MVRALDDLIAPLTAWFSRSNTFMLPGDYAGHYTLNGAGLEGFSRPFWGILPCLAGGERPPGIQAYINEAVKGMANGVNPMHPDYWGDPFDNDQRFVEMAVIGLSLLQCPDLFWNSLKQEEQENLNIWLGSVNDHSYPPCNWLFFRVFVNIGLTSVGAVASPEQLAEDIKTLDSYYKGDGWYADGNTDQYDYYISFGMHFYGMLYAALRVKEDPENSLKFKKRAALFAKDFQAWFAPSGEAVAYGRSQTYRFAQGAFWAAAAFCSLEEEAPWLTPGIQKGLLLRHLRSWFRLPIFTETGLLTIGYGYPNLIMAENYNASGSPYWALKGFFALALSEDSDFWQSEEAPLPQNLPEIILQQYPRFLIGRDKNSGDVTILNGGQYAGFDPRHSEQKYGKLAYTSRFSFSVPTGSRKLEEQSGDNTLMLKTREGLWMHRGRTMNHRFSEDALCSDWAPREGIIFRSILTWLDGQMLRLHLVRCDEDIQFCEGGCVCPIDDIVQSRTIVAGAREVYSEGKGLESMIYGLTLPGEEKTCLDDETALLVAAEANSNLLFNRTNIPTLWRHQTGGSQKLWGTLVKAGEKQESSHLLLPEISYLGDDLSLSGTKGRRIIPGKWLNFS